MVVQIRLVQSGAGALVKTEPPTLTSHFPCDSQITVAGFNTAWICLLANRKLSKSVAHGWLNLLGGPTEKNVLWAPH